MMSVDVVAADAAAAATAAPGAAAGAAAAVSSISETSVVVVAVATSAGGVPATAGQVRRAPPDGTCVSAVEFMPPGPGLACAQSREA